MTLEHFEAGRLLADKVVAIFENHPKPTVTAALVHLVAGFCIATNIPIQPIFNLAVKIGNEMVKTINKVPSI